MDLRQHALLSGPQWIHQVKPLFSSISSSLAITIVKLQGGNNYISWAASVELWFTGQGFKDHLEDVDQIDEKNKDTWAKIAFAWAKATHFVSVLQNLLQSVG